jgi:D-arginine utilization repressor
MKKKALNEHWKKYEPLIKAVVELFSPFVEAAIHDLEQGKVVAIYHNLSQRRVGDTSPLKELKIPTKDFPEVFSPYYKKNWDGRSLKCTSITLRNESGKPIVLICFNVDVSFMQDAHVLLSSFLKIKDESENPIEIFGSQSEEHIIQIVQHLLDEKKWSLNHLNRSQKKDIVQFLYHKGVFNFKSAAPFIAHHLSISRASVYNYIKELGNSHGE